MSLSRNNLLLHRGELSKIGGTDNNYAAAAIVSTYDFVVVQRHIGASLTDLIDILTMVRQIKPEIRIFGYTSFNSPVSIVEDVEPPTDSFSSWQTAVDQWILELPQDLLNGVFIDRFDLAVPITRQLQNEAIVYIHNKGLSAFVDSYKLTDVFETSPPLTEAPLLGTDPTVKDFSLLRELFFQNQVYNAPEAKAQTLGRLEYVKGLIEQTFPIRLNLGFLATVGMGEANTMSQEDYDRILKTSSLYAIEGIGLTPLDYGLNSNKYFGKNRANDFE